MLQHTSVRGGHRLVSAIARLVCLLSFRRSTWRTSMASHEFQDQLTQFLPKMRVWALALTRNGAAADDLVQEVALKTLVASENFIPGTNFSAWCAPDHHQSLHFRPAPSPRNRGHRTSARNGRRC